MVQPLDAARDQGFAEMQVLQSTIERVIHDGKSNVLRLITAIVGVFRQSRRDAQSSARSCWFGSRDFFARRAARPGCRTAGEPSAARYGGSSRPSRIPN